MLAYVANFQECFQNMTQKKYHTVAGCGFSIYSCSTSNNGSRVCNVDTNIGQLAVQTANMCLNELTKI